MCYLDHYLLSHRPNHVYSSVLIRLGQYIPVVILVLTLSSVLIRLGINRLWAIPVPRRYPILQSSFGLTFLYFSDYELRQRKSASFLDGSRPGAAFRSPLTASSQL